MILKVSAAMQERGIRRNAELNCGSQELPAKIGALTYLVESQETT